MNDFGLLVVGLGARATLLGLIGFGVARGLRKKGPEAGASVALATLSALVAVAALAFSPWPRWWSVGEAPPAVAAPSPKEAAPEKTDVPPATVEPTAPPSNPAAVPSVLQRAGDWVREGSKITNDSTGPAWRWPAYVGIAFLVLCAVGFARLILAMAAVAAMRRLSRPVDDEALIDMVELIRAEMSCRRRAEVREVAGAVSPATFGWRRPVILLPTTWREWEESERKAVLAHELAHIRRGDFLAGLIAQASLSLHFYHPLAHGLVGRLRLEQELAADAWGARLLGSNRAYLAALAKMALRRDDQPLGWPTRAFLPGRDTLMRRIEMLKDQKATTRPEFGRRSKLATAFGLATAALLVAGLRGPLAPTADASPTPQSSGASAADFAKLPADAQLVVALRPAELLARPDLKKLFESFSPSFEFGKMPNTELGFTEITSATFVFRSPAEKAGAPRPAFDQPLILIASTGPRDWAKTLAKSVEPAEQGNVGGKVYTHQKVLAPADFDAPAYSVIDDRHVVLGTTSKVRQWLAEGPVGEGTPHAWDNALKAIKPGPVTILASGAFLNRVFESAGRPGGASPLAMMEPLATKTYAGGLSLHVDSKLSLETAWACNSDEAGDEVAKTIDASAVLGRNLLRSANQNAPEPMRPLLGLLDDALKSAKVVREGRIVKATAQTDLDAKRLTEIMAPAVRSSRAAAERAVSVNNLKQIGLAFHNYHDAYGQFPPAVLYGPDGKTTHSWRVAILPFLDQNPLYQSYKFDEPWDSPANRKVLDKMPQVYAASQADLAAKNASYFTLIGPSALFPPQAGKGVKLSEIFDGASNTILAVEAKRPIPWTKPEDIAVAEKGALPAFGGVFDGGFNALFADGAVRFISTTINELTLRALVSSKGGEVVQQ